MGIELYKQHGLDFFKRFEIAIPQKKTEKVLQIGNEIKYKTILSTNDSKHLICFAYGDPTVVHVREIPSGKCVLQHTFEGSFSEIIGLSEDNIALIAFEKRKNLFVKFPEGIILKAISGFLSNIKLCDDKKSFLFELDKDFYLYRTPENILRFANGGKKLKNVHLSHCGKYALICYEYEIEVFNLLEYRSLYFLNDRYKIFDVSLSQDSKYLIYSARDSSKDGYIKTFVLESGKPHHQFFAILHDPEFLPFSKGWVFEGDKILIYYPELIQLKEINCRYLSRDIVESNQRKFLFFIDSYRKKDYTDWNKFVVYDIDRIYDSNGIPSPILQVEYQTRFSEMIISPDKKMVAVYFPSIAIIFFSTDSFIAIGKIEIASGSFQTMCFSACSNYFAYIGQDQLLLYGTLNFQLLNKPIAPIKYSYFNKSEGLLVLVNSLNDIQIRYCSEGNVVLDVPAEKITPNIIRIADNKIWINRYNGNYYFPEVIDIKSGEKKQFDLIVSHLKHIENQYFICNSGIFNTQTEELIDCPSINNRFDDSYFYSFFKYSVKVNKTTIEVFENDTGKLMKQMFPPASKDFSNNLTICGDYIIYEIYNPKEIYIEQISGKNPQPLLKPDKHSYRDILNIDQNHFLVRTFQVDTNTSYIYIYHTEMIEKPIKQFVLEGNLYKSTVDSENQRFVLFDYKICWYIDLKKAENIFSIKMDRTVESFLYKDFIITVSENNKVDYYNTLGNKHFKPGELLATLYTIPDGILWTIPSDKASPEGWFWTNKPEYIEVMQYVENKHEYELLPHDSSEREKYIELHNRKDLVMSRLNDNQKYFEFLSDLHQKIQLSEVKQYKHQLAIADGKI